ncbi:MAG: hypothetical protein V5A28_13080 [Haloarculaceae archaeon]
MVVPRFDVREEVADVALLLGCQLVVGELVSEPVQFVSDDEMTGYLPPVERAGVPEIRMTDGPMGIRADGATLFPASIGLAVAFDADLAERFGRAIGAEDENFCIADSGSLQIPVPARE